MCHFVLLNMRSYVNMHTYNWCVDKMCMCASEWSPPSLLVIFFSLRPCTHAGHAGRLVERRKEVRRQRTRLLQSAARLAVDRPPCSPEPLKSSPPTKAIRTIWIPEQKYILSFSLLVTSSVWHPPLIPLSSSLLSVTQTPSPPAGDLRYCMRTQASTSSAGGRDTAHLTPEHRTSASQAFVLTQMC